MTSVHDDDVYWWPTVMGLRHRPFLYVSPILFSFSDFVNRENVAICKCVFKFLLIEMKVDFVCLYPGWLNLMFLLIVMKIKDESHVFFF